MSLVESSLNQSSLIEISVDKISQVPGGTHLFENIFNAESIQIIKTSTDRFTTSQTDKFIYLIVEMKDLTEKELKLKIDGQYYFEKTNQMLKKLFSGMNQKLNCFFAAVNRDGLSVSIFGCQCKHRFQAVCSN